MQESQQLILSHAVPVDEKCAPSGDHRFLVADAQSVVDGPPAHCAMDDIEVVSFEPEVGLHAQYGSVFKHQSSTDN